MSTAAHLRLPVQPITAAAFAPYGWLADTEIPHARRRTINGGSSQRVDGFGALSLHAANGHPMLAVFRAQPRDPEGPWQELERHRLGSQTFVPLRGARCVVLVALGAHAPRVDTLAAFAAADGQAFTLHPGTWHHGLIALTAGDFLVLEREGPTEDCETAWLEIPVSLHLQDEINARG